MPAMGARITGVLMVSLPSCSGGSSSLVLVVATLTLLFSQAGANPARVSLEGVGAGVFSRCMRCNRRKSLLRILAVLAVLAVCPDSGRRAPGPGTAPCSVPVRSTAGAAGAAGGQPGRLKLSFGGTVSRCSASCQGHPSARRTGPRPSPRGRRRPWSPGWQGPARSSQPGCALLPRPVHRWSGFP